MHKPTILATRNTKEMAEFPPVEIGTRGTVGSLLMQEIEYFSRLEFNFKDWSQENKSQNINMGSSQAAKLLPKMCSMVNVSDNSKQNRTSPFGYKNLKSDIKFQL
ncbi:hypothetical protein GYH30_024584 [Glycine max]|uniref:Uncharacterized protein n=1 Tax=Glycine max TaxID=3847 RepID=A0A0R0I6F1_SOYBN|nr:hypothetical protein GYH30_024584 [Glycine max]